MCVPGDVTFYGDEHMAKRPLQQLVQAMRDLGVAVDCETGCPPLTIHGTGFPSGKGESHGKAGFLVLNNAFLAPKHCLSRSKTVPFSHTKTLPCGLKAAAGGGGGPSPGSLAWNGSAWVPPAQPKK